MSSRRSVRQLLVAVLLGVLVGGGLMAVTPAGAEVSNAVATNWKKIWKKNLKPLADRRYYTKAASDAKYSTKAETAAGDAAAQAASNAATDTKLGSYYKKTESDAKYAAAGSGYTKSESDARYAPTPTLFRGSFWASGGTTYIGTHIGWNVTVSPAPTAHYIAEGAPVPAGCSGSAAAPNASPGHLCVFESYVQNIASRSITNAQGATGAAPWGAALFYTVSGNAYAQGSWAMRPAAGSIVTSALSAGSAGSRAQHEGALNPAR